MPGRDVSPVLQEKLASLPDVSGVYLMKDETGTIIYVGKAVNLKNRVRTYFQDPARLAPKVAAMMRRVHDFELITTDTEVEALILEATLVKRHQPRYNIRLKDDKAYPYLRLTLEEDYPRLLIARRVQDNGSRYFGPYTRAGSVHETIRLLRRIFPLRNCTNHKMANAPRPCLEYHIKRCGAPCQGWVDRAEYRRMIGQVELVLEGRTDEVEERLIEEMREASEALAFEKASRLRDQVMAIREITAQQKVSSQAGTNMDVVAWAVADEEAHVQVFRVREGRLIGRDALSLAGLDAASDDADIAAALLAQYYEQSLDVPAEILTWAEPREKTTFETWLRERRGSAVALRRPQRGEKARLLEMVRKNAELSRDEAARRLKLGERDQEAGLLGIQHSLGLGRLPHRMECYDISNTQGTESVASMVVFTDGRPDASKYRRFRIRTVEGPNDFASMAEVIRRRFHHAEDSKFAEFPDLVIVDGGKGQLGYAYDVLQDLGVEVPIFGLAKQHEWLFEPGQEEPIVLDRASPALRMLQHLRDEAHRFAITYHRKLRTRRNLRSELDGIPEIGPKRKKLLLQRYHSLEDLKTASLEDLASLPGMTRRAAESVQAYLNNREQA